MNKVIKGKRYDTDTAEIIEEIQIGTGRREELYRKRTGEFFLAHWTQWQGEESWIQPLGYDDAREWLEDAADGDTYERIFGEVGEDGGKVMMCISVMAKTEDTLKKLAVERKISVSEMIDKLVADWMRKNKN